MLGGESSQWCPPVAGVFVYVRGTPSTRLDRFRSNKIISTFLFIDSRFSSGNRRVCSCNVFLLCCTDFERVFCTPLIKYLSKTLCNSNVTHETVISRFLAHTIMKCNTQHSHHSIYIVYLHSYQSLN